MGVGKSAEAFLPRKSARNPASIIDESGRSGLNIANQIRKRDVRLPADKDVKMIRHIVDGEQLLALSRDDAGHVLLQLIVVLALNQVLSALNSKNDMDVNLRVGVGHDMPLLRSLPQFEHR